MSLISAIHVAKSRLGMDDDTYRAFLRGVVGKTSCKDMTKRELWRVMEALQKSGFNKTASHKGQEIPRDPQARKIRALWLSMADAGVVRNRSEQALNQYVRRITGQSLETATIKQCQAVIETLKAWVERADNEHLRAALAQILASDCQDTAVVQGKVVAGVSYELQ